MQLSSQVRSLGPYSTATTGRDIEGPSGNRSSLTTNNGRSAATPVANPPATTSGMKNAPPGIVPPSSMYTAIIPPDEMAAFEASNFKNVKGVYKNCRGIWAAQWTDERGQRHTKYFNPKYYDTEAEARREAFRFKVHIAREIELRGGMQKRRVPKPNGATAAASTANDSYMSVPYMRERCRRISKKSKIQAETPESDFVSLGYSFGQPPSRGSQNTSDYLMLEQQHQQHNASQLLAMLQQSGKGGGALEPVVLGVEEFDGSHLLSNSTCSPSSASQDTPPQAALLYNSRNFDSIFLPPSASSSSSLGGPYVLVPQSEYSTTQQQQEQSQIPDNSNSREAGQSSCTAAVLPPGTSMCVCGCGELAIAPSRYSSHHHIAMSASDLATSASAAEIEDLQRPTPLFPRSNSKESILLETSAGSSSSSKRPFSVMSEAALHPGKRKKIRPEIATAEGERLVLPDCKATSSSSSKRSMFPPYFTYPTSKRVTEQSEQSADMIADSSNNDESSIASLIAQLTSSRYAVVEPEQEAPSPLISSSARGTLSLEEGESFAKKGFGAEVVENQEAVLKSSNLDQHYVSKLETSDDVSENSSAGAATQSAIIPTAINNS